MKRALFACAVAFATLSVGRASAEPDTRAACVAAYERGIKAQDRGAFREAAREYASCAASTCARPLRVDCAKYLDDLNASAPSVVFGAKDSKGADLFDVAVAVDGEAVDVSKGTPITLDPGAHVVRFTREGSPTVELRIMLRAGEHNRPVLATMSDAPPGPQAGSSTTTPPPASSPPTPVKDEPHGGSISTAAWIFGAVGVVGLASFATFGVLGSEEKSRLEGTCSPACTDAQIGTLRAEYVTADVSLAVGVVALGLAAYFALTSSRGAASVGPSPQRFARTIWK